MEQTVSSAFPFYSYLSDLKNLPFLMDKINDILKSLRDRISNPLISSFILSWLLCNWQITIALLFNNEKEFDSVKYITEQDINYNVPILVSIGYTFAFPFIRNVISAFQTWVKKWGGDWDIRIAKDSHIPMSKYLKLRDDYKERTEYLEKIIKDESKTIENFREAENLRLKAETKLVEEQQKVVELIGKNDKLNIQLKNVFNVNLLNGEWSCTETLNRKTTTNTLYFNAGEISIVEGNQRTHTFDVRYFHYDDHLRKIFFVKKLRPELIADALTDKNKLVLLNELGSA